MYKKTLCKNMMAGGYVFQRISIMLAIVLWLITAIRMISVNIASEVSAKADKDIVSVFCDNVYRDISSEITAYGVLTESYLSDDARQMMLSDMADYIGLNTYRIVYEETDKNYAYSLVQNSVYGDVEFKIIYNQEKYYLIVDIKLDKGLESTMQYRKLVEDICDRYGIKCSVNVCLSGVVDGNISIENRKDISNRLLNQIGAKEVQSRKTMDMFTVYAYDKNEKSYIMLGNKKVNINISMEYDENKDETQVYLAIPICMDENVIF